MGAVVEAKQPPKQRHCCHDASLAVHSHTEPVNLTTQDRVSICALFPRSMRYSCSSSLFHGRLRVIRLTYMPDTT